MRKESKKPSLHALLAGSTKRKIISISVAAAMVLSMVASAFISPLPVEARTQNFGYTGGVQTWVAPYTGTITLEVWGARGGYSSPSAAGGKGGYAKGNINVTAGQTIYIYVGGAGGDNISVNGTGGGWNGGGNVGIKTSGHCGGGGGATDIRVGGTSLNNRVIVAGGGGGAGSGSLINCYGGYGGGVNGGDGGLKSGSGTGSGATQTHGGFYGSQSNYRRVGSLGQGAHNNQQGGGAGGGYWGGGVATDYENGAGGGSGYVGGCIYGTTSLIAGNASMPNPSGGTMVGNYGHGYARITYFAPPSAPSISANPTSWTNGNVTLTLSASAEGGMDGIYRNDGTKVVTGGSGTYTVSANGTYSFYARDNVGQNSSTSSITISNIDKTAPNATFLYSTTAWTNGNVVITCNATDSGGSGVSSIKLPNSSTVTSTSTTYTVSANGSYNFVITDEAGNKVTKTASVSNIDKAIPTGTASMSPTGWTNGNVTITVTGSDTGGSGVASIIKPGGTTVSGSSATHSVFQNGAYDFYVEDTAGNQSDKITVNVTNIDTTAPTLTLSAPPGPTVYVTAADGESGISVLKWAVGNQNAAYFANNGTVFTGSSFTAPANGTITVYARDVAGNETVKTIDVTIETSVGGSYTLTPNTLTDGSVTIRVTGEAASGIKSIEKPDGTVVTGSDTVEYTVSENGAYTFIVTSNLGNTGEVLVNVTNINVAPSAPGEFQAPTAGQSVVTAGVVDVIGTAAELPDPNDNLDHYEWQYKVGLGDWIDMSNTTGPETSIDISSLNPGAVIRFRYRAVDTFGLTSEWVESTGSYTRNTPPTTPGSLRYELQQGNIACVQWNASADPNPGQTISYILQRGVHNGTAYNYETVGTTNELSYYDDLNGLPEGSRVAYRVIATDAIEYSGYGVPSPMKEIITNRKPNIPGEFITPAAGSSFVVSTDVPASFTPASVLDEDDNFSHYEWQANINGEGWVTLYNTPIASTDFDMASRAGGTTVSFRVRAVDADGAVSDWVESGTYIRNTLPAIPAVSVGSGTLFENSVYVSWPIIPDADGQTVTYFVERGVWNGTEYIFTEVYAGTATSFMDDITSVERGAAIVYRGRAFDGMEYTTYSEPTDPVWRNRQPGTMAAPSVDFAVVRKGDSVLVTFPAAGVDPDNAINRYEISAIGTNGALFNDGQVLASFDASVASGQVPTAALPEDTNWRFVIRAVDAMGASGEWSPASAQYIMVSTATATAIDEAVAAVENAEATHAQADIDAARALVNALISLPIKQELDTRLNAVQVIADANKAATDAVVKAENTYLQADVDAALILINNANVDASVRSALEQRLAVVQQGIDEYAAILAALAQAENNPNPENIGNVLEQIEGVEDGQAKSAFLRRIARVQEIVEAIAEATEAVEKAEQTRLADDIEAALELIENPDINDETRSALMARLNALIESMQEEATAAVRKAESSLAEADIAAAAALVSKLPDGDVKYGLILRLQNIAALTDFPHLFYLVGGQINITYIYGRVEPSVISAEVTLSSYFHVDPNAAEDERFISPDITVTNTSTMPIEVNVAGMKATGAAPKVVAVDKYTDEQWSQLTATETKENIALGLSLDEETVYWFPGEPEQTPANLKRLDSHETMTMALKGKHGLSWPQPENFKYQLIFLLDLAS